MTDPRCSEKNHVTAPIVYSSPTGFCHPRVPDLPLLPRHVTWPAQTLREPTGQYGPVRDLMCTRCAPRLSRAQRRRSPSRAPFRPGPRQQGLSAPSLPWSARSRTPAQGRRSTGAALGPPARPIRCAPAGSPRVPLQNVVMVPDLTLWGTGREAGPPFLLSPAERCSG